MAAIVITSVFSH